MHVALAKTTITIIGIIECLTRKIAMCKQKKNRKLYWVSGVAVLVKVAVFVDWFWPPLSSTENLSLEWNYLKLSNFHISCGIEHPCWLKYVLTRLFVQDAIEPILRKPNKVSFNNEKNTHKSYYDLVSKCK